MTPELTVLALAGLLQVVQFLLVAVPANAEAGPKAMMGPRDDPSIADRLSTRTQRLRRAFANHFEALVLFTLAVVVVTASGQSSGVTAACAWTYLAARILYVPAYAFGLMPWRSVIWGIGLAATVVMILAALV